MEEVPPVENVLETYLQALCEHLESKNQLEQSRVKEIVDTNNALAAQLRNAYSQSSKSHITTTSTLVSQETTYASQQACEQCLSTKLQQIRNCSETIEQKMKEEIKRFRENFYGLLELNDVSVKPYYDIKDATDELQKKIQQTVEETEKQKQKAAEVLSSIQSKLSTARQTIANLEDVKRELSLNNPNLQNMLREKLADLVLDPTTDLKTMHSQEEELRREICEMNEKLNELN